MRRWHDPIVWSHVPIAAAVGCWFDWNAPIAGVALGVSLVLSVLHHRARESNKRIRSWDFTAACLALSVTGAHFLFVADEVAAFQAALILLAALIAKKIGADGNYRLWHTVWHFLVGFGQLFMAWHWLELANT